MAGTKAGAAKRKQAAQAVPLKEVYLDQALEADHPVYVVGPKRALMHEGKRLEAGEVVPGAHKWLRLESWINTGRIVRQA